MALGDLVQSAASKAASDSFDSTPTSGNLLIAQGSNRDGGTGLSISWGGTWIEIEAVEHKPTDETYRATTTAFYKISDGTETGTITITGADWILLSEVDLASNTLTEDATGQASDDVADFGNDVPDITVATGSLGADDRLMIAGNALKHRNNSDSPWGVWSVGTDDWLNYDGGTANDMSMSQTTWTSSASGVQTTTAEDVTGQGALRTIMAWVVAFSYDAGGGGDLEVDVNDGSTVTDAVALAIDHARTVADAGTASDAVALAIEHARTVADAGTASDAVTAELASIISVDVNDGGTATDGVGLARDIGRTLGDGSTVLDVATPALDAVRLVSDAGVATDSVSALLSALSAEVNDTGTASDNVALALDYARSIVDAGTATDAVSAVLSALSAEINDGSTVTDAVALAIGHGRTVADTSSATDAVEIQLGDPFNRVISDAGLATDAVQIALLQAEAPIGTIRPDAVTCGALTEIDIVKGLLS